MLKNYFKIALRNLRRNKLFSFINISGLAVGLSVCILILFYVRFERSFDQFNTKENRIYRVWTRMKTPEGQTHLSAASPMPLGKALKENIPGVVAYTRLYVFQDLVKTTADVEGHPGRIMMADPDFFRIFDFKLLRGNRKTVFSKPNSIVLTPGMASRFFGKKDPLQQTLSVKLGNHYQEFDVTGIIQKSPANSSLKYSMLIPFSNARYMFSERMRHSWSLIFGSTYILFQNRIQPGQLTGKLNAMIRQEQGSHYRKGSFSLGFQPLSDVHLDTKYPQVIAEVTNPVYAYILAVIALLVLAIACINFITLSVSQSTSRAREVGIRKTIGAERKHLMLQSWGEAFLITAIAMCLGIVLSLITLPLFNRLTGIVLTFRFTWFIPLTFFGLTFLVSLIVGIYPALILSGMHPGEILRGKLTPIMHGENKGYFYKSMVVFQFILSLTLIIATFIVHSQMNYIQTTNLGYNKNELVVLPAGFSSQPGGPGTHIDSLVDKSRIRRDLLRTKLQSQNGIENISATVFTPVQSLGWYDIGFKDNQGHEQYVHFNVIDENFLSTMGIKLVKGHGFSRNDISDQQDGIIVNQILVKQFGWKHPIGKRLPGSEFGNNQVIGVVKDFHYESLYKPIKPLVLAMNPRPILSGVNWMVMHSPPQPRYMIRLHSGNLPATMSRIRKTWTKIVPGSPFKYSFVDAALDRQYRQSERFSEIVTTGSILAIILACLGLFGLSSLLVVRRTKEIGIRKVLGASVTGIVVLLSEDFLKLVGIGFLIAVPIAWYAMHRWLENFAYHIHIGVWTFVLAGLLAMVIALLTVSWQSIKAAVANPVESLRNE